MDINAFVTYNDVYKKDISSNDSVFYIKLIFRNYRKDVILSFLGYISQQIGVVNTPTSLLKIQEYFGIQSNGLAINPRSILVLYQIFYDSIFFKEDSTDEGLQTNHVSLLFLYANQILNKTDFEKGKIGPSVINIQLLMSMMKLYVGSINAYEINTMEEYYLLFYEKLATSERSTEFNKVLIRNTNMDIHKFIDVFYEMKENKHINSPFELFDKFAVLKFEDITAVWKDRKPILPIPNEYRFLEQYPLIKRNDLYYGVPPIQIFMSLIRKPYHVLSNDPSTKDTFRAFWGTNIVEPIIKQFIKRIFECPNTFVIDIDFQKKIGFEPADVVIVNDDDIFLLEIKSGYMGLADRYSASVEKFKNEFEKKYVYNSSGKHQLLNQLGIFDRQYNKIIKMLGIDINKKYKVFSCSVVFDEALTMIGFKRYLAQIFNNGIEKNIDNYKNFTPYLHSNLMTFSELLGFERRVNNVEKRIQLFKQSFFYLDSMNEYFSDIKNQKIQVEGIIPEDVS